MSELAIRDVIRQHIPRDRYNDDGTERWVDCICGSWRGDYFADGYEGPFDDHLAAAIWAVVRRLRPEPTDDQ